MKRICSIIVVLLFYLYTYAQTDRMIIHIEHDSVFVPISIVDSITFDKIYSTGTDNVLKKTFIEDTIRTITLCVDSLGNAITEIFDIANYGLFVDILPNKKYTSTGDLSDDEQYSSTTLCPLDKESSIVIGTNGVSTAYFYDSDKTFISKKEGYLYKPLNKEEYPENAKYIAFSFRPDWLESDNFYTLKEWDDNLGAKFYSTIKKIKGPRPIIHFSKNDPEGVILGKLINTLLTQDCDVVWETGVYEFLKIYQEMWPVYNYGQNRGTYELPVGGNCRYFFNNSTIIGHAIEELGDTKLFGTYYTGSSFEMYDATLVADGMTYVIHDEGFASENPYTHKYKNLAIFLKKGLHTTNGSTCFGGGSGLRASVIIEDCLFNTDNDLCPYDLAFHGIYYSPNAGNLSILINGCYFTKGVFL